MPNGGKNPRSAAAATLLSDPDKTDPNAHLDPPVESAAGYAHDVEDEFTDAGEATRHFRLVFTSGPRAGTSIPLNPGEFHIGRSAENEIPIPDVSISRHHARLVRRGDSFQLFDLGSGNGTLVNKVRVETAALRAGDEISLGDSMLRLEEIAAEPPGVEPTPGPRAVAPTSAPSAAPPAPAPAPAASMPPQRKLLYIVIAAILVMFAGLGVLKARRGESVGPSASPGGKTLRGAAALLAEGRQFAREGKWADALAKFEEAAEFDPDDPAASRNVEGARFELRHQQRLQKAGTLIQAGEFVDARETLAQIDPRSDVHPQVAKVEKQLVTALDRSAEEAMTLAKDGSKDEARALVEKVLAFDPHHGRATEVKQFLDRPPPKPKTTQPVVVKVDPTPVKPKLPGGPAVDAYLAGDLQEALRLIEGATDPEGQRILRSMRMVDAAFREGKQKAVEKRASEAARALAKAFEADAQIAKGRPSPLGAEIGRLLAQQEYLLGVDARGDDALPRRTEHFRTALKADPTNALAKKQLDDAEKRAVQLYLDGYTGQSTNAEQSCRLFRIVIRALPPGHEYHVKASDRLERSCTQRQ